MRTGGEGRHARSPWPPDSSPPAPFPAESRAQVVREDRHFARDRDPRKRARDRLLDTLRAGVSAGHRGPPSSFTFAAAGDFGAWDNETMLALAKRAAGNAAFLLALGDLGYRADEAAWCGSIKGAALDLFLE